jgi:hypothetical protein
MLLPDNIRPENTVYYNGAIVLKSLQQNKKQTLLDLYQSVTQSQRLSFSLYILCLDWLYLINAAKLNKLGEIELCS